MRLDEETIAEFLAECERRGCSLWIRRAHRRHLEELARWLGNGHLGAVQRGQDAQGSFLWWGQSPWCLDWTVLAGRYGTLVAFERWLHEGRLVEVADDTGERQGGDLQ
jgi:hypothetical protein